MAVLGHHRCPSPRLSVPSMPRDASYDRFRAISNRRVIRRKASQSSVWGDSVQLLSHFTSNRVAIWPSSKKVTMKRNEILQLQQTRRCSPVFFPKEFDLCTRQQQLRSPPSRRTEWSVDNPKFHYSEDDFLNVNADPLSENMTQRKVKTKKTWR